MSSSSAFAGSAKNGGRLILSTTSEPKTFNDIVAKETSSTAVTGLIFEGLTTVNPFNLQVEPNLAEGWERSEDGLVWTFHLRRGVRWNDGVPFTADDVVFTFNELIYNPDVPNSSSDIFTIDGQKILVEKIDNDTVRFTLPVRFAPFLRSLSQSILPKHKLVKAVTDKKFNFTWGIDTDPKDIVGTGPFQLTEYQPAERIVFRRNSYYWKRSKEGDQLPYLDGVVYVVVQNQDTALLKFLDGELDYYGARGGDYPLLKPQESAKNFTLYEAGPDSGSDFVVFNQNTTVNPKTGKTFLDSKKLAWFTDVNFRRAIAHAIDRQRIIEILMNGLGYELYSPISPNQEFYYNPNVVKYPFNLDVARKILADAGYLDRNDDGVIEDKNGNDVEFRMVTNSGAVERIQIGGIIRSDLESLGMKVNFKILEFNTLVSQLTATFDWDAAVMGLSGGGADPHFSANVWLSTAGLHVWNPYQQQPATAWEARVDEIFREGVKELDENKRKILYDEFQMIISEQVPLVYTVLNAKLYAVRNRFGNLKPTAYGGAFHNLEEIYIRK